MRSCQGHRAAAPDAGETSWFAGRKLQSVLGVLKQCCTGRSGTADSAASQKAPQCCTVSLLALDCLPPYLHIYI